MAYKALYRKYRPETFDSVVGQKHIIKTLENAIANNKVAHAYIFSGPRGTGKTTTAKLLAKALNCLNENKPCNECENCKAINEGTHPDIVEIDAASNNGVEEVRDLIEKVKYAPILGKYKVYIIDEVHMMTPGAFNALLKTLEEPPEHVVFILATTDVHKVLPTILSRCQRFDFSKISFDDIKNRIIEILNKENITFEENVPSLVAELADGGMRDALSILDQVVSYAGEDIKMQHVYDIYGMMSNKDMVTYLSLLAKGNVKDVLSMIEEYIGKGIDVKRLTYDLMVCLKDAIVYKSTKDESILERLNKEYAETILENYSIDTALKVSDLLAEARNNYRLSTNYRLFFEMSSLKIMETIANNKDVFIEAPKKEIKKEEIKEEIKPVIEKKVEPVIETPKVEIKKEVKTTSTNKYEAPEASEVITYSEEDYINIISHGDKRFKETIVAKWGEIRKAIDNIETRYIAQLLADATIGVASEEFLMIVYEFKLLANRAKQRNNLVLISKFLKEIYGYEFEIYVVEKATFLDITNKWFQLRQANKLPGLVDIPHMPKEIKEVKQEKKIMDQTTQVGYDLFGDDLKVE